VLNVPNREAVIVIDCVVISHKVCKQLLAAHLQKEIIFREVHLGDSHGRNFLASMSLTRIQSWRQDFRHPHIRVLGLDLYPGVPGREPVHIKENEGCILPVSLFLIEL
jgi:hypothetical protein